MKTSVIPFNPSSDHQIKQCDDFFHFSSNSAPLTLYTIPRDIYLLCNPSKFDIKPPEEILEKAAQIVRGKATKGLQNTMKNFRIKTLGALRDGMRLSGGG